MSFVTSLDYTGPFKKFTFEFLTIMHDRRYWISDFSIWGNITYWCFEEENKPVNKRKPGDRVYNDFQKSYD